MIYRASQYQYQTSALMQQEKVLMLAVPLITGIPREKLYLVCKSALVTVANT
jgi:hypothetical protein